MTNREDCLHCAGMRPDPCPEHDTARRVTPQDLEFALHAARNDLHASRLKLAVLGRHLEILIAAAEGARLALEKFKQAENQG